MEAFAPLLQDLLKAVGPVGFVFLLGWCFSEWRAWQAQKRSEARRDKVTETLVSLRIAVEVLSARLP